MNSRLEDKKDHPKTDWNQLSNALNRYILTFCDNQELANMAAVSAYWAGKCNAYNLWEKLAVKYYPEIRLENAVQPHRDEVDDQKAIQIVIDEVADMKPAASSTQLIKKQFARYHLPENSFQRKAAEFKRNHPEVVGMIEVLPAASCAFAINHPAPVGGLDPFIDYIHENTPHFEQMGFFAGRLYGKAKPAIKVVKDDAKFLFEVVKKTYKKAVLAKEKVKEVFCCRSSRPHRS